MRILVQIRIFMSRIRKKERKLISYFLHKIAETTSYFFSKSFPEEYSQHEARA